jgi:UDP-N-acetylmuramoyl-L-alanyl-D-glutamate--2,6-diaminopimelate ligase
MILNAALAQLDGIEPKGNTSVAITGVSYDSRTVEKERLFVAIRGEKMNGDLFVHDAIARGAAAVASENDLEPQEKAAVLKVGDARKFLAQISQLFFEDPASHLKLAAFTGTNGKTTSSYLLESVYRQAGLHSCLLGTIGIKIDGQPFPTAHTTPESPDLLFFLRKAVNAGCTHGVLEVSSHALALKRVFGTKFTVAVFTNLTPDHLDFHKDMESYYQAKRLLFVPENDNRIETAAINTDDPYGRRLAAEIRCPSLTFGMNAAADVHPLESRFRADGTDLRIATPRGEVSVRSPLLGRPNTQNILGVIAAAISLNLETSAISRGIESLQGIPGRMEVIKAGQPFTMIVDYAHTPDALEKLLNTVADLPHRRIITIFGCGGDRDRTKRPIMGEIAARLSDFVVATSDNPRTEDPLKILAEIKGGLEKGRSDYVIVVNRREAIAEALGRACPGDVVVLAGKGHETNQIIGTKAFPFDDRLVAHDQILKLHDPKGAENTGEFAQ